MKFLPIDGQRPYGCVAIVFGCDFRDVVDFGFYRGLLAEHIVGQELICLEPNTRKKHCFWTREKSQSSAEIDFLMPHGKEVIPIEVKSGKVGTLRSMHQFMDSSPHRHAVRLYAGKVDLQKTQTPTGTTYWLLNMPYFLTSRIHQAIDWMISQT